MKESKQIILTVLFVICSAFVSGCSGSTEDPAETATIAPATPEPNVDVEDDPAFTQTVDPGENRSPYEGGPIGEEESGDASATSQERQNPPNEQNRDPE